MFMKKNIVAMLVSGFIFGTKIGRKKEIWFEQAMHNKISKVHFIYIQQVTLSTLF